MLTSLTPLLFSVSSSVRSALWAERMVRTYVPVRTCVQVSVQAPFSSPGSFVLFGFSPRGLGTTRTEGGGRNDRQGVEGEVGGPHLWACRPRPAPGSPIPVPSAPALS